MTENAIEVRGIVKRYGARTVLDHLDIDVPVGEVLALVGPSGGGKSTMLRCMTGLEVFEEGSLRVADAELVAGPKERNARAYEKLHFCSGLVFQQWHLFPHRTALENVMEAPLHVKKEPLAKAREHAKALLAEVGLSHREDAMPRAMSGGEQQRCAIARALAMHPKVLFMDEPTSALDPQRVGDLVELLERLVSEQKLTMVVVTHEMAFAQKLADRAIVLYEGRIIEDGEPNAVLESPSDPRTRAFLGLEG
jgi:ABC-type polar amino acid transport system ATPase subunit